MAADRASRPGMRGQGTGAPKLSGWIPLRKTVIRGSFWGLKPLSIPVGGHFTAQNGPIGPGAGERAKIRQNKGPVRPKTAKTGPKRAQTPVWSLPTRLNQPSVTNDMPIEIFGLIKIIDSEKIIESQNRISSQKKKARRKHVFWPKQIGPEKIFFDTIFSFGLKKHLTWFFFSEIKILT